MKAIESALAIYDVDGVPIVNQIDADGMEWEVSCWRPDSADRDKIANGAIVIIYRCGDAVRGLVSMPHTAERIMKTGARRGNRRRAIREALLTTPGMTAHQLATSVHCSLGVLKKTLREMRIEVNRQIHISGWELNTTQHIEQYAMGDKPDVERPKLVGNPRQRNT